MSRPADKELISKVTNKIKAILMLYGLSRDYFSYGTTIKKRKDGKYKVETMEGTWYYTLKDLAYEWDLQDNYMKIEILNSFREDELHVLSEKPIDTFDLSKKQKECYISWQDDDDVVKDLERVIDKTWTITPSNHNGDFRYSLMICNEEYDLLTENFVQEIYRQGE